MCDMQKPKQRVSHLFFFFFMFLHKTTHNTSGIHCFSSSFCSTCSSSQRSSIGMRSPACSQKSGSEAPSGSPAARGRSMSTACSFHMTVEARDVIFVGEKTKQNTLQITNKWQEWTLADEVWHNSLSGFNVNFSFGWDLLTPTETLFLVAVCMCEYFGFSEELVNGQQGCFTSNIPWGHANKMWQRISNSVNYLMGIEAK